MVTAFTGNINPSLPCAIEVDTSCCTEWDSYSTDLQTAAAEYGALMMSLIHI
jgi:hypothetical protein